MSTDDKICSDNNHSDITDLLTGQRRIKNKNRPKINIELTSDD